MSLFNLCLTWGGGLFNLCLTEGGEGVMEGGL